MGKKPLPHFFKVDEQPLFFYSTRIRERVLLVGAERFHLVPWLTQTVCELFVFFLGRLHTAHHHGLNCPFPVRVTFTSFYWPTDMGDKMATAALVLDQLFTVLLGLGLRWGATQSKEQREGQSRESLFANQLVCSLE